MYRKPRWQSNKTMQQMGFLRGRECRACCAIARAPKPPKTFVSRPLFTFFFYFFSFLLLFVGIVICLYVNFGGLPTVYRSFFGGLSSIYRSIFWRTGGFIPSAVLFFFRGPLYDLQVIFLGRTWCWRCVKSPNLLAVHLMIFKKLRAALFRVLLVKVPYRKLA